MSMTPSRVNYFEKQFLRCQEFSDEQGYQLALRRRHNIAHHSWGIVVGLEVTAEESGLVVRPGLAIDGYGRELFLPARALIKKDQFTWLGSNRLDVWLYYERANIIEPPAGYSACGTDVPDNRLRTAETPRVFLERAGAGRVNGRQPKAVPKNILTSTGQLQTPDDPLKVWPIYLGRVTFFPEEKDPLKQFQLDLSDRPYAGIVAEVIDHPANATRVEIGKRTRRPENRVVDEGTVTYASNDQRAFAVFVPSRQTPLEPRFEIDVDDSNFLRGNTTVHGNLVIPKGVVQFTEATAPIDEAERTNQSIYRAVDMPENQLSEDGDDKLIHDELRIDLGQITSRERTFVIGHTLDDGTFRAAMKLEFVSPDQTSEPQPLLTIYGDLKLKGLIASAGTKERTLAEETLNALLASFQAGMGAAEAK